MRSISDTSMCEAVMKSGKSLSAHDSRSPTRPPAPYSASSTFSEVSLVLDESGITVVLVEASRAVVGEIEVAFETRSPCS